jgi:hypothetical protein
MLQEMLDGCIRQRTTQTDFNNDFRKAVWGYVSAGETRLLFHPALQGPKSGRGLPQSKTLARGTMTL